MMMLSLQATAQSFSSTHQGWALYYNITSDSTVEVTKVTVTQNYSVIWDVVIPAQVEYSGITYSVTSIGRLAFYNCSGLTSINVASGNTHYSSIDGVLYNYVQDTLMQCPCAKTSITIPNSVTSIGNSAFSDCSGLT